MSSETRRERRLRLTVRPEVSGDLLRAVRQSIIGMPRRSSVSELVFALAETSAVQKLGVRPAQIQEAVYRLAESQVFDIWAYVLQPSTPAGEHRLGSHRVPVSV